MILKIGVVIILALGGTVLWLIDQGLEYAKDVLSVKIRLLVATFYFLYFYFATKFILYLFLAI